MESVTGTQLIRLSRQVTVTPPQPGHSQSISRVTRTPIYYYRTRGRVLFTVQSHLGHQPRRLASHQSQPTGTLWCPSPDLNSDTPVISLSRGMHCALCAKMATNRTQTSVGWRANCLLSYGTTNLSNQYLPTSFTFTQFFLIFSLFFKKQAVPKPACNMPTHLHL